MRNIRLVCVAVVTVWLASLGSGRLAAQDATGDASTQAWFVELSDSVDAFRRQASAAGAAYTDRFVFRTLWRGLSVNASADTAAQLRRLPSVRAVFPVLTASLDPVVPTEPDLAYALALTGANAAHENGITGAGVKVGVIDTGIDYHHQDLGGGFGAGFRVVAGYDFVGDRFDSTGSGGDLIPHPDGDPDDCNGHGTHVAGIIGASGNPGNGGARGVAPGVTFGAYRVFGCDGATLTDIIIAAMERALADGMQVLNISIGSAFQTWPQYPTAAAADALVDHGVVVVASIGNSGASGIYSAGAPGIGTKVIGVASVENTHINLASFIANPGGTVMGYAPLSAPAGAEAPPLPPSSGTTPPIVFVGRGCVDADLNTPGEQTDEYLADPAGKVALIVRGACSFNEKYARAAAAGAAGVMIQNNAPGIFFGGFTESKGIFGIGLSQADGNTLRALATPTATWTDTRVDVPNPVGPGRISSFSSYGLTAELDLKPDLAAPGGFIRSTVPLEAGAYDSLSGTSMAAPHVAGAVALLLSQRPDTPPAMVRTILQNSADPIRFGTSPTTALLEVVHRQGAGMLDVDDAIAADTLVSPGKIALGEGTGGTRTLSITNNGTVARTYALGHQQAVATFGSSFAPSGAVAGATAVFSRNGGGVTSVVVQPGATETVDVTFTTPPLVNGLVYGGFIVISAGPSVYRVPYAGLWGDYQSITVLAPGGCVFPGVFKLGGQTECPPATPAALPAVLPGVTRQPDSTIFNVEDRADRPVLLFHLAHQSRRLEIRAVDEVTGGSYLVAYAEYLPRHATNGLAPGGFGAYAWDGKRIFTNASGRERRQDLPPGLYRLQVVVTKALAQKGNAAHIETWTSPVLNLVRYY